MGVFIVYTVDARSVTIIGCFSTHEAAHRCCERVERAGNPNVWMVCTSMDKNTIPHRVEVLSDTN